MFEVGRRYEFRMIEGGDEILFRGTVDRYEHPLIKIADAPASSPECRVQHGPIRNPIINVTSPNFTSAYIQED